MITVYFDYGLLHSLCPHFLTTEVFWSAVSSVVAVGALIWTTIENRKRFNKDFIRNNNKELANDVLKLTEETLSTVDHYLKVTSAYIINQMPKRESTSQIDIKEDKNFNKAKESNIAEKNEVTVHLESLIIKGELLKLRIKTNDNKDYEYFNYFDALITNITNYKFDNLVEFSITDDSLNCDNINKLDMKSYAEKEKNDVKKLKMNLEKSTIELFHNINV